MYTFQTEFQGLPNRTDKKYMEIGSFELYELPACIAYEAAIRVSHIKKSLTKFSRLYHQGKSKYCTYELKKKLSLWHCRLCLKDYGFDLEASLFYAKKRENPSYCVENKKLISTPNKYTESIHGDIIRMIKMPNGEIRRRNMRTHLLNRDITWYEFGFSPMFNLKITTQHPIIKNVVRHKYFLVPLNMNLSKDELIKQITVTKKIFDEHESDTQEENEISTQFLQDTLPLEDRSLKDIATKLMAHATHFGKEKLLSSGDLGVGGGLFYDTLTRKKHDPSKVFADIFYVYDSMKLVESYNLALKKEKELLKIEILSMEYEDEEDTLNDLEIDFKQKEISKAAAMTEIYSRIKDKKTEKRGKKPTLSRRNTKPKAPSSISDKWAYAQDLIDDGMYESLM